MLGRQESPGRTALALITLSASNSLAETCSESVRHMLFPESGSKGVRLLYLQGGRMCLIQAFKCCRLGPTPNRQMRHGQPR